MTVAHIALKRYAIVALNYLSVAITLEAFTALRPKDPLSSFAILFWRSLSVRALGGFQELYKGPWLSEIRRHRAH